MSFIVILICFCFVVQAQEKRVGINTDLPKQTLDINGTLSIETLGEYTTAGVPILWNKSTKQVLASGTSTHKPFNKITYTITCTSGEDWIGNFDTKIDANKYVVIITNTILLPPDGLNNGEYWGMGHIRQGQANVPSFGYRNAVLQAYSFVQSSTSGTNTWRLNVDYPSAAPWLENENYTPLNRRFKWQVELLVIAKPYIKIVPDQVGIVDNNGIGTAVNSPI